MTGNPSATPPTGPAQTGPTATSVPSLPRGVRLRYDEAREQWLLMGPERLFKLDAISLEILRRCDGENDLAAIVEDLARSFGAEAAAVETDVQTFLTDLANRGMVILK
ncbi:pyrroloquinoline quinone biosynthesis peptide chaperone PqqD [Algihabitans albus]|uniref:pyrroloquinoline quinone biosynthesis peptide chaperone PqqD n=1 Tax=Algihabitans albus TaxID=2164067 RepID=UPI000E5D629F|nr:pyrroloquinoline quinone biosynthesis peptide chaperone PqqD [Algihabitans albus]